MSSIEVPQEIFDKLIKDPQYLTRLAKRATQADFKDKYHVTQASGLRCPKCSQYGLGGGSLWWDPASPKHFVCRKCLLEFHIEGITEPIERTIAEIKESKK